MKSKALGALIAVAILLNLTMAGAGGYVLFRALDRGRPTYPANWDARVLPLVHIVEQDRGLPFKHPVYVDFLDDAKFKKEVVGADDSITPADRREIQREEGILRAVGVIAGDVDLLKETQQLGGSGIVGLYSLEDKRIRVRGAELTEQVKVTLVHELTHALQDQQFGIAETSAKLDGDKTKDGSAFRALFEGDAVRIETKYRDSLPDSTKKALDALDEADGKKFDQATASVPPFMQVDFDAPYSLGEALVGRAADQNGNGGVDALFAHPPTQVIQAMDPWLAGKDWAGPQVAAPALKSGEKEDDRSVFGAFDLYLVLAQRLPLNDALQAADGWGGDAELDYSRDKTACIRTAFVGRDAGSTAAIGAALTRWARGAGSATSVNVSADSVVLDACDPGTGFKVGPDHSLDAAYVLGARNSAEEEVEKDGGSQEVAICFANGVLGSTSVDDLHRIDDSGPNAADDRKFSKLAADCRGGGAASTSAPGRTA